MPFDSNGVWFDLPNIEAVPGQTIESADWNGYRADLRDNYLNTPRTVIQGGTGASNGIDAGINLFGGVVAILDKAQQFTKPQRVGPAKVLTSGTSISLLLADGNDYTLTLAHNATLTNPSDISSFVGQKGRIAAVNAAPGNWTFALGNLWFPIGAVTTPAIPPGSNAKWRIDFDVVSSTRIDYSLNRVG